MDATASESTSQGVQDGLTVASRRAQSLLEDLSRVSRVSRGEGAAVSTRLPPSSPFATPSFTFVEPTAVIADPASSSYASSICVGVVIGLVVGMLLLLVVRRVWKQIHTPSPLAVSPVSGNSVEQQEHRPRDPHG